MPTTRGPSPVPCGDRAASVPTRFAPSRAASVPNRATSVSTRAASVPTRAASVPCGVSLPTDRMKMLLSPQDAESRGVPRSPGIRIYYFLRFSLQPEGLRRTPESPHRPRSPSWRILRGLVVATESLQPSGRDSCICQRSMPPTRPTTHTHSPHRLTPTHPPKRSMCPLPAYSMGHRAMPPNEGWSALPITPTVLHTRLRSTEVVKTIFASVYTCAAVYSADVAYTCAAMYTAADEHP